MGRIAAFVAAGLVAAGVAAAVIVVLAGGGPPAGPLPVAWDRQDCAHCRMLLSEPAFAVQAHLSSGEALFFDDPGCWFLHEAATRPEVHAVFFRSRDEDAWLGADEAGFVRHEPTPMGFGLAAVRAAPGTLSLSEARDRVLAARPVATGEARP